MITLAPLPEEFAEMASVLLDLADSVNDVQTTTATPQLGLVIPEYLYERYQQYLELDTEPDPSLPARKKRRSKP